MTRTEIAQETLQRRNSRPKLEGELVPIKNLGGHNRKFQLDLDSKTWLVKICEHDSKVFDICEREELASTLGHLLEIPTIEAWTHQTKSFRGIPNLAADNFVLDKCVVMPLLQLGNAVARKGAAAELILQTPSLVADIFAFLHWLGDEDRGLADVLVDKNRLILIDNGLIGPPTFQSKLRGSHPTPESYDEVQIIKKCYPGKPSLVALTIRDLKVSCDSLSHPAVIDRITAMPDDLIRQISDHAGLASTVGETLVHRKRTLDVDYASWLTNAFKLLQKSS